MYLTDQWSLSVQTAPTVEPISIDDVKPFLRLGDFTTDDGLIRDLITTVREQVEARGYALINQTLVMRMDCFPTVIKLPRAPLVSVTSIQYVDVDGVTQTLAASKYDVDTSSVPARITPAYNESWPLTRSEIDAVTVTFVAGYGANPSDVPERVRTAMKIDLATLYYCRIGLSDTPVHSLPTVDRLLDNHTLYR